MGAPMTVAPVVPMRVVLHFIPVGMGLPDAETNVLLGLDDGSCLEGFLDGQDHDGEPIWRDVSALQLAAGDVVSWAELPEGLNDPDRHRMLLQAATLRHKGTCTRDDFARAVCEGMYVDRVADILGLAEALRAVYALAGESPEVSRVVHEALRKHGGPGA